MTEAEQRQQESPLRSDRGSTTIKDTVVSKLAGMAASEVEGVHMGGGASRSAGGLLGGITGSEGTTRGVSVEVGSVETALDLKMGIDYGKNILGTVGEVRQKVTERVHSLTGLNVTELNVTIADVVFPDESKDAGGEGQKESATRSRAIPDFMTRATPGSGESPSGTDERETTPVEPRSRAYTEGSSGPVPEEDVRAEGTPVEEDETRRLRVGDEEPSATQTNEAETAEAESETTESPGSETSTPQAEAPTDETTLTGGTSSGETVARETASGGDDPDDRTREINREQVAEGEERRSRRRRRREQRDED